MQSFLQIHSEVLLSPIPPEFQIPLHIELATKLLSGAPPIIPFVIHPAAGAVSLISHCPDPVG